MKTLLILILAVALAGAAFFTRPSESSFQDMVKEQADQKSGNLVSKLFSGLSTDSFIKSCTYKDHYLWTTVEKDGQTIYVGAFAHWFEKGTDQVKKTEGTKI
jgi:hypothetical protein